MSAVSFVCEQFLSQFPLRPYCTDDLKKGLRIRPLAEALKHCYIQANPPGLCWVLIFDVDHPIHIGPLLDSGVPDFTWMVNNPFYESYHVAYVLKNPVCTSSAGHLAPLRYLAAIEEGYRLLLDADPLYTGLITKNPERVDFWRVEYMDHTGEMIYTLDELAAGVLPQIKKLRRKRREQAPSEVAGLGRNCYIFEHARKWAYRAIRDYWGHIGDWYDAVENHCSKLNKYFNPPLYPRELMTIARSIDRWTVQRFTAERFSESQRQKILLRWEQESRKPYGLSLLRSGLTPAETAETCGVSLRTAQLWRSEAGLKEPTLIQLEPWEMMGISKRWYYELKTEGRLDGYQRERDVLVK